MKFLFRHIFYLGAAVILTACGGEKDTDTVEPIVGLEPTPIPTIAPAPTPIPEPTPAPETTPVPETTPTPGLNLSLQAFELTLHLTLQAASCANCHGDGGDKPPFAISDSQAAFDHIVGKGLVSLEAPSTSEFILQMEREHNCGVNCDSLSASFLADITLWAEIIGIDPEEESPVEITPITFSEKREAFSDTVYPLLVSNCSGCHSETSPDTTGITPKFAHTDVATAHAVVENLGLVSFTDSENSRLVTRLLGGHTCWSDCAEDANTVLNAIIAWKEIIGDGDVVIDPVLEENPSVSPPTGNKTDIVSAFGESVWLIVRENCAGCHDGGVEVTEFADADKEIAYDALIARNLVDIDNPSDSVIVKYLRDRLHRCWPDSSACESNANAMEAAIALWKQQIEVDDEEGPAPEGNTAPVAVDDNYQTQEGIALTTDNVTSNDADADDEDTLSILSADTESVQGGSVVNNGNGTFTYTPPAEFSGEDSFTYTIVDSKGASDTATVTIRVIDSQGVIAVDDLVNANQNAGVLIINNLLDNDIVSGSNVRIVTTSLTSDFGGFLEIRSDTEVAYQAPNGFSGTDKFTYSISDGLSFSTASVTVSINTAAIAVGDSAYTYTGVTLITDNVLTNDIDFNGDVLSVAGLDINNTAGDVTNNGDGTFSYEPLNGVEQDSFTYFVSDGRGGISSAEVNISIVDPFFADDDRFLTFLNQTKPSSFESEETASVYYSTIDPSDTRETLDDFIELNRFDVGADAKAIYINNNDLGLTRRMFIKADNQDGTVASYIENYENIEDALRAEEDNDRRGLIVTLGMEYNVVPGANVNDPDAERVVTFYAWDDDGDRILEVDLDGRGDKFIPGACLTCHGGETKSLLGGGYRDGGDTGAGFIPWDIDNFLFEDDTGSVPLEEEEFKIANETVLATNPGAFVIETIQGWYGGETLSSDTFFGGSVPDGWQPPAAPISAVRVYSQVVRPFCRTCHSQQGDEFQSDLDFSTYDKFMSYKDRIEATVFDEGTMPLSRQTSDLFFENDLSAEILAEAIASNRLLEPDDQADTDVVVPGRPIANPGPSRTAALGRVELNGAASLFVEKDNNGNTRDSAYRWSLSVPANSEAELEDENGAQTSFIADEPGEYRVTLVVNSGGADRLESPPGEVVIVALEDLIFTSFSGDIVPVFAVCAGCHKGFDNPRFDTQSILFDNAIEYINLDDVVNSKILTKPLGLHHDGGVVKGFENTSSEGYQKLLRWITEGAREN